jgi:hypothetical protein
MVVIAGKGLLDRDLNDSIMQFERSRELSRVRVAKLSGISVKRLDDRLSDRRVLANGCMLFAEMVCKELSAKDRYFNFCHLLGGRKVMLSRFDELSLR